VLKAQGIDVQQQIPPTGQCIDIHKLTALARKRTSSRFDNVFPSRGGGPFFTSFVYNERAVFYTFKVCYVWSNKEVQSGEPQYAELIELQMLPKDIAACQRKGVAKKGFELRLEDDKPTTTEGSQDSDTVTPPVPVASVVSLEWTSDVHRETESMCVCVEDPVVLSEDSGLAIRNRLHRQCCKDGDWEKVITDELRLKWLHSIAESVTKLGATTEVATLTEEQCKKGLSIRGDRQPDTEAGTSKRSRGGKASSKQ